MKQFSVILLILAISSNAFSQDLSSFTQVAHYTMNNTAADELGLQEDLTLINVVQNGSEGVYCNGKYIGNSTDASLVSTGQLDALYKPSFAVQVELKIDPDDGLNRPVLVCGDGWRYFGFYVRADGTWSPIFNDAQYFDQVTAPKAQPGQWYQLTMVYSGPDSTARWYIDGTYLTSVQGTFNRPADDGKISNTHYGIGSSFKGSLRNLKIFESDGIFSGSRQVKPSFYAEIFPNPVGEYLHLSVPNQRGGVQYRIFNSTGAEVMAGNLSAGDGIDLRKLRAGDYFLHLHSSEKSQVLKFIKK